MPQAVAAAVSVAVAAALQDLFAGEGEKIGSPYAEGFVAPAEDPQFAQALSSFRAVDRDCNNLIVRTPTRAPSYCAVCVSPPRNPPPPPFLRAG